MRGVTIFTPQMIAGSTQKEGMYHFFEIKETALSLMVPNVGSKWKQKKDAVNTFKISKTGRLLTLTTEIFGIPLMKHSQYALKHCLVDVKGIREHALLQKRLPYLPRVSEASWNICTNAERQGMGNQHGSITFSHFTDRTMHPLKNYCCLFTHRYKTIHLEKSVIDPLFVGIVSFHGEEWIMSVSKGGEPDFKNLTYPPCTEWAKSNQQSQQ